MSNIQSNTQISASNSQRLLESGLALQRKEITKDNESNITAKASSIVTYERGNSLKISLC